jgi:hypothetical protein
MRTKVFLLFLKKLRIPQSLNIFEINVILVLKCVK